MAVHTVVSGDSLSAIATANGISLADLLAANPGITDPDRIAVNDTITLPDGAGGGDTAAGGSTSDILMSDPSYSAFMRTMGFKESEIESNLAAVKDAYTRDITRQESLYGSQREQATRSNDTSFEARGMFHSGARATAISRAHGQISMQEQAYRDRIAEQNLAAERTAAANLADLRRQRDELEITTREKLTMENAAAEYGI